MLADPVVERPWRQRPAVRPRTCYARGVSRIGLAPAKLNLSLRVLGRRPDGYHEVETLLVPVDPCDIVRVRPAKATTCVCDGVSGENLAARAADLVGVRVAIEIDKRIPIAAGLGGGSSDAACVLRLLGAHDRFDLAARLGTDVPFFLRCGESGGAAWATGTGADVEPLAGVPPLAIVLVAPPGALSTADMYAALDRGPARMDRSFAPDLGGSLERLLPRVQNDFLALALARVPGIAVAIDALRGAGARAASLSGKGPACFGLYQDRTAARVAADRLRRELPEEFLVLAVSSPPRCSA